MNLRQLRYFCEVVETGGGNLAAKRLFVAPTAISNQIGLLEQHLGGTLFDRSTRPMQLTPLGKFFYPRAKELLLQVGRLDDESRGIATGTLGWLGIGFARSAIFSILPNTIRSFREAYAEVHLDLIEVLSEYQAEQLQQRRIDIGISRFLGTFEQAPDMDYKVLIEDPFIAALSIEHPLAKKKSISIAEFASLPFILYPKDTRSPFGQQMLAILKEQGINPVVAYEAIELHTALALVGAGLGGTIVGSSVVENNRKDVAFIPIHDVNYCTSIVAVTRKNDDSKILNVFTDLLSSEVKKAGDLYTQHNSSHN